MFYDENNIFDNCRFVADVMKTRQDLHFQALRLIHYVIYRVISDNKPESVKLNTLQTALPIPNTLLPKRCFD